MTEEKREIRRKKRVLEYAEKIGNNNTACRRFGIARSTFYLWRDRYQELGEAGLARRRPCSHNHPNKTPDDVVEKILRPHQPCHLDGTFSEMFAQSAKRNIIPEVTKIFD